MKKLLNLIIEKVGNSMARPTTLRPKDGGEIVLKNCSKETIEKVRVMLAGEEVEAPAPTPSVTPEAPVISATKTSDDVPLLCTSLGVYQNPLTLNWHMCSVKFSPFSKKGVVDTDIPVGRDKFECDEKFKISAVNCGLIG